MTVQEAAAALGWTEKRTREVLAQLTRKGWLKRLARGRYETVLAETGGWALPNPWAAQSLWQQPYYSGFQSAAYELGLTPDRPGAVQACVPVGAKRPRAWEDMPIELVYLRTFTLDGTELKMLHHFSVVIASTEKLLLDAAALPARVGGIFGFARIVDRALESTDWKRVAELAAKSRRGSVALRRIAATAEVLGYSVPRSLAEHARTDLGESPLSTSASAAYLAVAAHGSIAGRWSRTWTPTLFAKRWRGKWCRSRSCGSTQPGSRLRTRLQTRRSSFTTRSAS